MQCCKQLKEAYEHETLNPYGQFYRKNHYSAIIIAKLMFILEVNKEKLVKCNVKSN